ncbi:MAG TPA: PASTA domain-containing protein, partial [Oscillospiraceae bacterium]|nr:PASTA domain-containing protein [Oscillospiraceae bacterium]
DEDTGDNIVSFLGFAPADDPEVVVLLAYDSPTPTSRGSNYTSRGYYISGGNMAALMAGPLIADILDYMGVEKQYTASELQGIDTAVPGVISQSLATAESTMKEAGFTVRTVGDGTAVTDQIPAAGALIPGGSEVVLYLGEEKPTDLVTVPNVTNLSAEAANRALTNAGLYMKATGAADGTIAVGQNYAAGTEVERGTVVEVQMAVAAVSD